MEYELGIIGGGNMAEAIVRAAVDRGVLDSKKVIVSDPAGQRRKVFDAMGVLAVESNQQVILDAAQIMLAIKPQMLPTVAADLQSLDAERQIVMSIMAGITTKKLAATVGKKLRIVRVMPNTPLMVGIGMSGVAVGVDANEGDDLLAMQIFGASGEAVRLAEDAIDAVTAVSGSGPAYVFYLAEAMTEAAKSLDLPDDVAALLTQQTILGAATLMRQSPDTPAELRRKVTSPGGTTQAAIETMDRHQIKAHIIEAIQAAAARSRELGK
ncbi:MAG: pyrroline-5-carboxylate reductase [Planctomycetes bacterium]|nr:pyrroline-5-carboxylate reductase [Planctomycetota bacterium]